MDHFFGSTEGSNHLPAVNVKEDDNGFAVEVAAPGFEKADFKVEN
jgi:HSP20 family protein